MRSAYGLSDLIEKLGSQELLVLKSLDPRVRGMAAVMVVISQRPNDVDPKGVSRILPTRKMPSTS